jgi:hypothetical protein
MNLCVEEIESMLTYSTEKGLANFLSSSVRGIGGSGIGKLLVGSLDIGATYVRFAIHCLPKIYMIRQMINAIFISTFPVTKSAR